MITEEQFNKIFAMLEEINGKIDYQKKLLEEAYLNNDDGRNRAKANYATTVLRMEKMILENPSLKDSPIANMLMPIIRSFSPTEE